MDSIDDPKARGFEFTGAVGEWFCIWIVNLLLSVFTLGIYSAWAKVRRNKYFYNNTSVDGHSFDYHATGKQILIGRAIVVAAFFLLGVVSAMYPPVGIAMAVGLVVALPWLIIRSLTFNARMTSFSNVRFNFLGQARRVFIVYLLLPIVLYGLNAAIFVLGGYLAFEQDMLVAGGILVGLGLLVVLAACPFLDRLIKQVSISFHALGVSGFDMQAPLAPFFKAFAASMVWVVIVGLCGATAPVFSIANIDRMFASPEADPVAFVGLVALMCVLFFAAVLPVGAIYQVMTRNVIYGSTELAGGHRFRSNVGLAHYFWIILSNVVVVIFTFGLMLPWAQIRMAKYLAAHTAAIPNGSMGAFVGTILPAGSATGDAYTDLESIDIGLPV